MLSFVVFLCKLVMNSEFLVLKQKFVLCLVMVETALRRKEVIFCLCSLVCFAWSYYSALFFLLNSPLELLFILYITQGMRRAFVSRWQLKDSDRSLPSSSQLSQIMRRVCLVQVMEIFFLVYHLRMLCRWSDAMCASQ